MPRYELDGEPWQIEQIGKQLEITSGGKTSVRTFVTPEQAAAQLAEARRRARARLGVDPACAIRATRSSSARSRTIRKRRRATRCSRIGCRARATRAATSWRSRSPPKRAATTRRSREAAQEARPRSARAARARTPDVARRAIRTCSAWRFGVIHRAYLHADRQKPIDRVLDQLLRHASGRFLVELTLSPERSDPRGDRPARACARRRACARCGCGRSTNVEARRAVAGDAAAAPARAERSHALAARAGSSCRRSSGSSSSTARCAPRARACWSRAPFPVLEQLRLDFGSGYSTGDATIDDIFELLARKDLPALRQLALVHTRYPASS